MLALGCANKKNMQKLISLKYCASFCERIVLIYSSKIIINEWYDLLASNATVCRMHTTATASQTNNFELMRTHFARAGRLCIYILLYTYVEVS